MPTSRTSWHRPRAYAGNILRLGSLLAGCFLISGFTRAASETAAPREPSDKFAAELGVLRPLTQLENPNYPEIIKKAQSLIITLKLKEYDLALINQFLADLYLRSGEPMKAIKPIEDSFIGDYFPKETQDRMRWVLAQLYMQESGSTNDDTLRLKRLGQARTLFAEWFASNKEPLLGAPEMESYIDATLLYAKALFFLKDYKTAYEQAKKLVHLSIEPKDDAWVLLFSAQQECNDAAAAAETFELFIRKFPEKKDIWLQLAQAYLNSDQTLRAILTYQRAQSHGFMNAPSDYNNIFSLYYRIEEYSRASQLLESWILSGKVPDSEENWENVSVCYANLRRDDHVRTILDSARKRFKTGNLDFLLAQYLWYDGKYKEGLEMAESAWKKGGIKKPGKLAVFLATSNYVQRNPELAKKYFEIAVKSGDVDKHELERVGKMLKEALEPETPPPATAGAAAKPAA